MKLYPIDYKKVEELRQLAHIPIGDGEQFIHVYLNLVWGHSGHIDYGFKHKMDCGVRDFHSLDEAIQIVNDLRKRARL